MSVRGGAVVKAWKSEIAGLNPPLVDKGKKYFFVYFFSELRNLKFPELGNLF